MNKVKNISSVITVVAAILAFSGNAFANSQQTKKVKNAESACRYSVKYAGANEQFANFQVKLENETPAKVELIIADENGVILYGQEFEKGSYTKFIKIENGNVSDLRLDFIFHNLATNKSETYSVANEVKTVSAVKVERTK